MKLKTFNIDTTPSIKTYKPCLSINLKTGLFALNPAAQDKFQLKANSTVSFHQDEDEPGNWYLEFGAKNGFKLRKAGNNGTLFFNSRPLAIKIAESVEAESGGRVFFGEEVKHGKIELVTLLTVSLLKIKA